MFKGSIVALATPFTEENEVDYPSLRALVEWQISSGTDGIVLCGTTGEAPTLSDEEQLKIFEEGVSVSNGRIPIIAGTGSYDTHHTLEMTQEAKKIGADGALVIVPYYNRPTQEGCFQHFQTLAKAELPMIVYHHPGRTGVKLTVKTCLRIAEIPQVVAIKDATCDLDYLTELVRESPVPVMTGDDTLLLPSMSVGAAGVISVIANLIPGQWKQLVDSLLNGHFMEGRELFNKYYTLAKAMFLETNPHGVKYALGALNKCSAKMRLPLVEPQESTKAQIVTELVKAGLLLQEADKCSSIS